MRKETICRIWWRVAEDREATVGYRRESDRGLEGRYVGVLHAAEGATKGEETGREMSVMRTRWKRMLSAIMSYGVSGN